jgi:UDP-N-acetylenolpyruvoylglucosamine reductase
MSKFSKEAIALALAERVSAEAVVRQDESLARRTTLRVGGAADVYVEPAGEEDLARVLRFCQAEGVPFFLLGRGSNLLVRDGGIRGVVVCLAAEAFSRIEVVDTTLRCGAGARLKAIANEARRAGLGGFEFLEGIPGGVGGALRMNAGAMGGALFDVVQSVRFMDEKGQVFEREAAELHPTYRSCDFFKTHIALGALLRGRTDEPEAIAGRMRAFSQKRWEHQPKEPSAGCTFKNPRACPAGLLIDRMGLKGLRCGGAAVSTVHGNFIVNEGGATARDILNLIDQIQRQARSSEGIELETEVEIIGED